MTAPRQGADFQERLGERLKVLRENAGMSQRALAERMTEAGFGWHHSTVVRTENSQRALRLDEAVMLADLLNVDIQDLYQDVNPMKGAFSAAIYQARESRKHLERMQGLLEHDEDRIARARERHVRTQRTVADLKMAIRQKEKELAELQGRYSAAKEMASTSEKEVEKIERSRRRTLEILPVSRHVADRYTEHLNLVKTMRRNGASEDQFPPLPSKQEILAEHVALERIRNSGLTVGELAERLGVAKDELAIAASNDVFLEKLLGALNRSEES